MLSPVFYMFTDRERSSRSSRPSAAAACTQLVPHRRRGQRPAPRLGHAGARVPRLPAEAPARVRQDGHAQPPLQGPHRGVGAYDLDEAIEWGVTGPGCGPAARVGLPQEAPLQRLRAVRLRGPHRQRRRLLRPRRWCASRRCARACASSSSASSNMPVGPVQERPPAHHAAAQAQTMHDIETLIHHFLSVSWGPVIPPGEAFRRSRHQGATTATTSSATAASTPTGRASAPRPSPTSRCCPPSAAASWSPTCWRSSAASTS
jgi:NADH-quinone oxidoreductase subunit C/D